MGTKEIECPKCGGAAKKIMSVPAPPVVNGFSDANGYSNVKNKKSKKGSDNGKGKSDT